MGLLVSDTKVSQMRGGRRVYCSSHSEQQMNIGDASVRSRLLYSISEPDGVERLLHCTTVSGGGACHGNT